MHAARSTGKLPLRRRAADDDRQLRPGDEQHCFVGDWERGGGDDADLVRKPYGVPPSLLPSSEAK